MGKRIAYGLAGTCIGFVAASALATLLGKPPAGTAVLAIAICCGSITTGIAERMGKVQSIDEIKRPITLFPRKSDQKKPE